MYQIGRRAAVAATFAIGFLALEAAAAALKCESGKMPCDGACVNESSIRCNGMPECSDRSDELDCNQTCCGSKFFMCANGECLDAKYRCDGWHQCLDGTDEQYCQGPKSSPCPPLPLPSSPPLQPCGSEWKCIDVYQKCDAVTHCTNGWDEKCNRRCTPHSWAGTNLFICDNGECGMDKCNGKVSCRDMSDEKNCTKTVCNGFACEDGMECIPKYQRCNKIKNCRDGSDEWDCDCKLDCPSTFRCPCSKGVVKGRTCCVGNDRVCDGRPDCADHSDELQGCKNKMVYCSVECKNGECLEREARLDDVSGRPFTFESYFKRCNGYADCKDHSDEMGCGDRCTFEDHLFFCENGECTKGRCNGKVDCLDGSDEKNCLP